MLYRIKSQLKESYQSLRKCGKV